MVGNKTRVWGLKRVVQVTACVTLAVLSLGLGLTLINFVVGNAGNAHDSGYLGSTKVPGRGDGESLLVAEVDPIDKLLSTPSPYETILTDSRPKARKSRQSSTSQRPVQKKKSTPPVSQSAAIGNKERAEGAGSHTPDNGERREDEHSQDSRSPNDETVSDKALGREQGVPADATNGSDTGTLATTASTALSTEKNGKKKAVHIFNTVALFPKPISAKTAPQWHRVVQTQQAPPIIFSDGTARRMPDAVAKRWFDLRKKIEHADMLTQAKEVNKFFNTWPYRTDDVVWGVPEYWATPEEFLVKSGDCEDYAITKYYALRSLGVPADKMRIIAVKETIRGIGHAVLAVLHNETAYILDNLNPYTLEHTRIKNYAPQFSVNEEYRWGHARIVKKKK